jgi:hypothetical protein
MKLKVKKQCKLLKKINTTKNISSIVKEIDKIFQQTCFEIYKTRETEENITDTKTNKILITTKHGHCC